jgi:magnesium transporter
MMNGNLVLTDGSCVPADVTGVTNALTQGTLLWLDIADVGADGLEMLTEQFKLHPLAIEDVKEFGQRPKIEDFGDVVYLVTYGMAGTSVDFTEVHCFIAEHFLVTVRQNDCPAIEQLHKRLAKPGGIPDSSRPLRLILLHHILDGMIDSFFPRLSEFDDRVDQLQEEIFTKTSNEQLAELFDMQRWLVELRKLISPQRDMLASLVSGMVELPAMTAASDPYVRDLYDHLIRISDLVDSYRDLVTNAMSAYLSMVSNNLNEVMKQLAIIATIFLPLSFLTGFFGQNFGWMVNRLGALPTFLLLGIGTEFAAVCGLYVLFRHRGWIGAGAARRAAARQSHPRFRVTARRSQPSLPAAQPPATPQ